MAEYGKNRFSLQVAAEHWRARFSGHCVCSGTSKPLHITHGTIYQRYPRIKYIILSGSLHLPWDKFASHTVVPDVLFLKEGLIMIVVVGATRTRKRLVPRLVQLGGEE